MLDIGFPELLLAAIVALLVVGPERLPELMRVAGTSAARLRGLMHSLQAEIEQEQMCKEIEESVDGDAAQSSTGDADKR